MPRVLRTALGLAAALAISNVAAQTSALPKTNVKVVGFMSNQMQYRLVEEPFWSQRIPQKSKGAISADLKPFDQLGLTGLELMRLLKAGAIQFTSGQISYMAADSPKFEGVDLAGITLNIGDARKVAEAYKPVLDRLMSEKFGSKLLLLAANPPQVIWCRTPISGLSSLKGKKIRIFNQTLADFIEGAGGTAVRMAPGEVIAALQSGVIDCGVTGTLSGNTQGYPEVTTHLYPMYIGWSLQFGAVNASAWKSFDPKVQAFLLEAYRELEDSLWKLGAEAEMDGITCSTGGACKHGKPGKMTLVRVSDADKRAHASILKSHVIPNWAKRCGTDCAKEWNATIGKVLGVSAPTTF